MEHWIALAASGLSARGHAVSIIGRKDSEFLRRCADMKGETTLIGESIAGDFDPLLISRVRRFLKANKTDVIIVNFNKDIRIGGIAARLGTEVRVVWSVGLDIIGEGVAHRLLTPKLVDRVITPSHALRKKMLSHGTLEGDIIDVIPIGIPDQPGSGRESNTGAELRRKYDLPPDSLVAVTSGRFVRQKGHKYLIEAARSIVTGHDTVRFLWLGSGELETELRESISAQGLEDYFIIAGLLDSFATELMGADLMVHPSVEEPFGIVLLEAMRAGLPIVASMVGGIPEVVEANVTALLVPPCEPAALAEAVNVMLSDSRLRQEMGKAGRRRFEQVFRFELMIDRIEQCLHAVTDGKGVHG